MRLISAHCPMTLFPAVSLFQTHSGPGHSGPPAHRRRNLPCPGGQGTGPDWRGAAAAWRRRAQTLPLVDWGGVEGRNGGAELSQTAKGLLHRLFVPP